jgi:hypothetical protein
MRNVLHMQTHVLTEMMIVSSDVFSRGMAI